MSSEIAIRVTGVSKSYHVYRNPQDRLKQTVFTRLKRFLGRPAANYFREFWALKDISFEVKKGETVGIVGRNGSGKSTLLQIICGTLTPTEGSVEVNGKVAALLELGSGFNPEFTGRENVYLNGAVLGLSKEEIDARYDSIVAFADIGEFLDQPVKTYSSGMYVRLAFAVIAHASADILVIDEALAVGDAFFVQKCMRFLREFMKTGTVLFVSHDTGAVTNLCQRSIWLQQGRMALEGTPKEVASQYMKALYAEQQGKVDAVEIAADEVPRLTEADLRDVRSDFVNQTPLRNDIEVFQFDPDRKAFGVGGAQIVSVMLTDRQGRPLSWIVGGEPACLRITCVARVPLWSPIVGFMVKDRLGQPVFVDNTYLSYESQPVDVAAGDKFVAEFDFVMPYLPTAEYTVDVAVAEGTQEEHQQHHWIYDAMAFKVHASRVRLGLVGIPMQRIELSVVPAAATHSPVAHQS
jgi:lipopolysaccharide transport system ATP-binding protein